MVEPPISDAQLEAMRYETANWIVEGQQGQILGRAASLDCAIVRATDYGLSDAIVVALTRTHPRMRIPIQQLSKFMKT